jgi:hypothetical protein
LYFSIVLPIINWILSFIQVKLSYAILKFLEVLNRNSSYYYTNSNRLSSSNKEQYSFIAYVPFILCLFAVQVYYAQQYYKISYVFITNFVTRLLTLILLYSLPSKILSLPIFLYYLALLYYLFGICMKKIMTIS